MKDLVFFATDIHGHIARYKKLFKAICEHKPDLVLLGGDLLPHPLRCDFDDFLMEFLAAGLIKVRNKLKEDYPVIGLILGNDDARLYEASALEGCRQEIWQYLHMRHLTFSKFTICGYSCVPPTPFQLKDWERYDVSRYTDPGCIAPTEGFRTVDANMDDIEHTTIADELDKLTSGIDPGKTILLMHSPPYDSLLDRAALDGKSVDHVPLDVHIGSIALQRFISEKQPYLTLHGHVHESSRITGQWMQQFGKTISMNAALEGKELSLVSFDINEPEKAVRELL